MSKCFPEIKFYKNKMCIFNLFNSGFKNESHLFQHLKSNFKKIHKNYFIIHDKHLLCFFNSFYAFNSFYFVHT